MPDSAEAFPDHCRAAVSLAASRQARALIASDVATVRWLCGREAEIGWGPLHPLSAGTLVVLERSGGGWIVCAEGDEEAGPRVAGLEVATYPALGLEPLRVEEACQRVLQRLVPGGERGDGPVAVEAHSHSLAMAPEGPTIDLSAELARLRWRKDPAEIALLERAAQVVSAGQRRFRELARAGLREIDLFSEIHSRMESAAGDRVPVLPDLISGPRVLLAGAPPTDRVLEPGDLVLCDLVARVDGYWADSCTTICLGEPTEEMVQLSVACRRALEAGIAMARPGVLTGDLDAQLRQILRDAGFEYPHHSGHGLGTGYHEGPRIVPRATDRLETGMVIALEPGGFGAGIGCRVEHLIEVAEEGGRVLTDYDLQL